MYQTKEIEVNHPAHSGQDNFTEVQVLKGIPGREVLETFTGPSARIKARNYIQTLGWNQTVSEPLDMSEVA